MAALSELLGETLQAASGAVSSVEALAGKEAVALYFSAHWCPPCRGFTPQLADWYVKNLKARGLEVVFVSSDRDEEAFREYFGEMPWLALPFEDRERKEALSKQFKVQGIPTVVVLGADGKVITRDGRAAIASDPLGEEFPWRPKSLADILDGAKLLGRGGQEFGGQVLEGKVFALYFSAHWCPPCRGFTPQLAEWYAKSLKARGLEVVFVSSDKDEAAFKEYFGEMPWLALAYSDRKRKDQLSNLFGVRGIPSVVIVDKDGSVITKDGRAALSGDPEGKEFPWYPKPVSNLAAGPGSIQEVPTVVALCEACSEQQKQAAEGAMAPHAKRMADEQKHKGEEFPSVSFTMATELGGIADRLRELMQLPKAGTAPKLMLLDIPDEGGFYEGPEGEISEDVVAKFLADYSAKALKRMQLEG